MSKIVLIIAGMALVTYAPRVLPFALLEGKKMSPWLLRFLQYIPPAILGALIFPGVMQAMPDKPYAAIGGTLFAAIFAYFRGGMILPVFGGIIVTYLLLLIK